jgi:hypothetical protein
MATGLIAITVILSLLALAACTRLVSLRLRKQHNEFFGFNSALVGVFFAVLLAFIAVAASEAFDKASDTADNKAALTGDVFRDSFALPEPLKTQFVGDIQQYVQIVLMREWPAMSRGETFGAEGWAPLMRLHQNLIRVKTPDALEVTALSEILTRLNLLYDARRARILASHEHLSPALWRVVILGAAITILMTCFYGMESYKLHALMTGIIAASVALVIVLIVSFDYPSRGDVQVTPDGFLNVRHDMEAAGIRFPPGPT